MADKKIPVLTDVYQPKPQAEVASDVDAKQFDIKQRRDEATLITPELIARIAAHIKPRLEADIAKTVTENVREALKLQLIQELQNEVINTQADIESRTVDFVDKTKADLKTELPRMYQASADLVFGSLQEKFNGLQTEAQLLINDTEQKIASLEANNGAAYSGMQQKIVELQTSAVTQADALLSENLEATLQNASVHLNAHVEVLQNQANTKMQQVLEAEMSAFQTQAISSHQAQLDKSFSDIFQSLSQRANADLEEQARALQADTLAELRKNFLEAMPSIYTTSVEEQQETITAHISQQLADQMQTYQKDVLAANQALLLESMTNQFNSLKDSAQQDLQLQMNALETDMKTQASALQAEVLTQMRATMNEAIPSIYESAVEEVKAKFADEMTTQTAQVRDNFLATVNADLPVVQEVLRENIQHMLASALPALENDLRKQLTTELHDLLLKVKFVLPK